MKPDGRAFPGQSETQWFFGLSNREYFSALMMQGLLSAVSDYSPQRFLDLDGMATDAVEAADALIAKLK